MEKIAVQSSTEIEWDAVEEKMFSLGYRWSSDRTRHVAYESGWHIVFITDETQMNQGTPDGYVKSHSYTIISAQEYLNEGGKDVKEFEVGDRVINTGGESRHQGISGEVVKVERFNLHFIRDDGVTGNGPGTPWVGTKKNYSLIDQTTKTQTTKENNMELNSSIRTVLVEEDKADYALVEKMQSVFGGEIVENFTGAMILRNNKDEYLAEIKRLNDIEAKRLKEEAKKEGK